MHTTVAFAQHHSGILEHAQVAADRRSGHGERFAQFADRGGAKRQSFEHVSPSRMRQRTEHRIESVSLMINHVVNYKHDGPEESRG